MKKKFLILPLLVALLPFVKVSAKIISIYVPYGNYYTTEAVNFISGTNNVSVYVNNFINENGSDVGKNYDSSKLGVGYVENSNNYCINLGNITMTVYINRTVSHNWGYMSAGNRYYDFYTKIDGKSYYGVKSNSVTISPTAT